MNLSIRLFALSVFLLFSIFARSSPPVVVSVDVPNVDTSFYGDNPISIVITYGKASAGDSAVDSASIGTGDLWITLTSVSPEFPYMAGTRLEVWAAEAEIIGETVVATYSAHPYYPGWNPSHNGTWTVQLQPWHVATLPASGTGEIEYAPEADLATFLAAVEDVRAELGGRFWNDTSNEASLVDEGHVVDPGIEEWFIVVQMWDAESDIWTNAYDYLISEFSAFTKYDGSYVIRNLPPGDYRLFPQGMLPEFSAQAVGDPTRGGVVDGYYHFKIAPTDNGAVKTVNLAYREEFQSPHAAEDEFEIGWTGKDVRLDVLANDAVDPPLIHDDLRINGVSDYAGYLDLWQMESWGGWGGLVRSDGRFIYYTPPWDTFSGWEQFYYRVTDGSGYIDLERVWVHVVPTPAHPFEALDDFVEVAKGLSRYKIEVLENDVIFDPHEREKVTVTVVSPTAAGAQLRVLDGQRVHYKVPGNFEGTDRFAYEIRSSLGDTSTAQVTVQIVDTLMQEDPYLGRNRALEALFISSPEGRRLLGIFKDHEAEMFRILNDDVLVPARMKTNRSARDAGRAAADLSISERFFPELNDGLSELLLGNGGEVALAPAMVEELNGVSQLFATVGSPALRADVVVERDRFGPDLESLQGRSMAEGLDMLGVDPTLLRVQVYDPRIGPGAFSMNTLMVPGHVFSLWKNDSFASEGWTEVTDAVQRAAGSYVILSDPHPDPARTFYKIEARSVTP